LHKKKIGAKNYFYTSIRDRKGKIETVYLGSNKKDASRKAKSLGVNADNKSNFISVDSLNLQKSMFALLIVFLVFFLVFGMKNINLTGFVVEGDESIVDEEVGDVEEEPEEETEEEVIEEEDSGGAEEIIEDVPEEIPDEDAIPLDLEVNDTEEIVKENETEEINETLEVNETEVEEIGNGSVSNVTEINISEVNESVNISISNESLNLTNVTLVNVTEVNLTNNVTANITDTYSLVEINKPVKWKKKVVLDKETSDLIVEFDSGATDINVIGIESDFVEEEIVVEEPVEDNVPLVTGQAVFDLDSVFSNFLGFFKNLFSGNPTGYAVLEEDTIEIVIEESVKEVEIEYQLPGPNATEINLTDYKKQITISSDIHYENILTYTEIQEYPVESINLYWINNNTRVKQEFTPRDTNDNGLIDQIEWITPSLSSQTYEVEITILNVNTFVEQGKNWTVMFNTTGTADLKITAVNNAAEELPYPKNNSGWDTQWTIYDDAGEEYDLRFLDLTCGDHSVNYTWNDEDESIFVEDYSCDDIGYEVGLKWANTTQDIALRFDYGDQVAYAYDAPSCGGTISTDTTLSADLTGCTGHGLVFGDNGITLDCAGHLIDGDDGTSDIGIHSNQKDNLVIKNCRVNDFGYSIYLYNTYGSYVFSNNVSSSSKFGIRLYGAADGLTQNNVVENNTIVGSSSFQIVMAAFVNDNNFTGNVINTSIGDGIMFYNGRNYGNRFVDNIIEISADSWEYGLYFYKPTTVFENLTFINNAIFANAYGQYGMRFIPGDTAIRNFLFENTNVTTNGTSSSMAMSFEGYPQAGEISGFVVRNSVFNSTDSYVINYRGNTTAGPPNVFNNYFVDSKFYADAAYSVLFDDYGDSGINNLTMLNTTYDKYIEFTGGSTAGVVFTDWHLDFYVNSTSGGGLDGANVTAWDKNGNFVFSEVTDADGLLSWNLTEYNQTDDYDYFYYTNYTINTTYSSSSGNDTRQLNLTDNIRLNITLDMGNVAPNDPIPSLVSMDGTNGTFSDLNCSATITDPNTDDLNVSVKWYNNSVLWLSEDFNNSYPSATLFNMTLGMGNLSVGENWTCGMRISDGTSFSNWVNSTNLTTLPAASCGDTITTSTTLDSDLDCSGEAYGLQIGASDIFLDCAGRLIKGDDTASSRGIRAVTSYNNVTIKNCVIKNFAEGIYVYISNGSISNNTINTTANYGIIAYASIFLENTVIANNTVIDADSYAIAVYNDGSNSFINFNVTNNFVNSSVGDGIMMRYGHQYGHVFSNNYVELSADTYEYGFLIYAPKYEGFENISYINNTVVTYATGQYGVRIDPNRYSNISNILFDGNNITTSGSNAYAVGFDHEYHSPLNSSAHDIIFKNGVINTTGGYAIRYYANTTDRETIPNLYSNYFVNTKIYDGFNVLYVGDRSTSVGPNNLTFVNCTMDDYDFNFVAANDASVYVQEYLDVYVNDSSSDLENANVTAWDKDGNFVFSELTAADGFITRQNMTVYNQTDDAVYSFYTNYTMNTSLASYLNDTRDLNITSYLKENVTLASAGNNVPEVTTPILNSTLLTNLTTENLDCYFTVTDADGGDTLYANFTWYNGSEAYSDGQISVTDSVLASVALGSANTTKGETWKCNVTPYDETDYGDSKESNTLTILNTAPNQTVLISPAEEASITNRTPEFIWKSAGDNDGDSLTYDLLVDDDNEFGAPEIDQTGIGDTNYKPTSDLTIDTVYYWKVRAYDSSDYGDYSDVWNFTLNSYVAVTVPNNTVAYGSVTRNEDTPTGDLPSTPPLPFSVQNDGNAFINITVYATQLFDEAPLPSEYYQCKADDYFGEKGAFDSGISLMDFVNVTSSGSPLELINLLYYTENNDSAEVDINVKPPLDEEAVSKSSVMTFTAALSEEGGGAKK